MAEVITRFKLETTQYDSKLRDASKSMSEYARMASLAGNEFDKFTQKNVESAKALGNIATSGKTAQERLKELVSAFNDVSKVYNTLTQQQQQSDYGKAMAESLRTLQGRIKDAKSELYGMSDQGKDTGSVLEKLAEKFTLNIDALKLLELGIKAGKAALDVAKDAFFASEENIDEWGRTIQSAQAVYEGWLVSLNTGDISGFLSRIDEITTAARQAYDEVDRLQTLQTMNKPASKGAETQVTRLRSMLQTGRYIESLSGGFQIQGMTNGALLSNAQKDKVAAELERQMGTVAQYSKEEVTQARKAIVALYSEQAATLGMSLEQFMSGTANMSSLNDRLEGYKKYKAFEDKHTTVVESYDKDFNPVYTPVRDSSRNPYEQYKGWGIFKDDSQKYKDLVSLIEQSRGSESQYYNLVSGGFRAINRVNGITARKTGAGSSTRATEEAKQINPTALSINLPSLIPDGTTESMNTLSAELKKFNDMKANATSTEEYNIATEGINNTKAKMAAQETALQLGVSTDQVVAMQENIQKQLDGIEPVQIKIEMDSEELEEDIQALAVTSRAAASAVGSIGSALASIENPTAKVAGIVLQAIANIALSFSAAMSSPATTAAGVFGWIAAAAGGVATMNSTIQAIHDATGYALGGEIKGNSYSNDQLYARVNAGETILTKAQSSNIAGQLKGSEQTFNTQPYVSGEQIFLGINNWLRSQGRGEIVTTK